MKSLIFILGITLVSFTNVCNASNKYGKHLNSFQEVYLSTDNCCMNQNQITAIKNPYLAKDSEEFNPDAVIVYNQKTIKEIINEGDIITEFSASDDIDFKEYENSMKEIILQFDLITENSVSNEVFSLTEARTIENRIAELEQIIESTETNEVSPLDFDKINTNSMMTNTFNSKRFLGMN
jgi:hypothetical protein